jgi:hypothetical protein
MWRIFTLLVMLLFTSLCAGSQPIQATSGQDSGPKNQQPDSLPQVKTTSKPSAFRPRLSLQEALKIAEVYIGKEHIDIRPFWLYRAIYIGLEDKNVANQKTVPGWHFWWVNDNGALGDYVEIFVDLNGRAYRVPSM